MNLKYDDCPSKILKSNLIKLNSNKIKKTNGISLH